MCNMLNKEGDKFMYFHEDNKSVTESIDSLAVNVVKYMTEHGLTLSAAESCTGGLLAAAVTSVSGASAIFKGSAVTYTEEVKMKLLGVSPQTLERYTVYSKQTAEEMSRGAKKLFDSDAAVGITGIAGPGGAVDGKSVGTVYISAVGPRGSVSEEFHFEGGRQEVRLCAVREALKLAVRVIKN